MTHRERLMAAVSHRQPDRVPIDLGGTRDSTLVVEGYQKLKRHFRVEGEDRLCDRMMRVVEIDERILKALDVDTRAVYPGFPVGLGEELGSRRYRDFWGVERIQPEGSYYYDLSKSPLAGEITISDIVNYPWPDPEDPVLTEGLKERVRWVRNNTDCAAILAIPAPFIHISQYLRGFEDWYCDFVLQPKRLEALFDAILEITIPMARTVLKEAGQDADVVICGDDLGTQKSLQVSRDHYLRYIKPRHARFFRQVRELTSAKILFHTCGAVSSIIDDLIEIGIDILNPVQPTAEGMDPVKLRRRYRGRIAFWGGTDNQTVFPRGTVQEVKKMVEDLIEGMGEGGGFVLSACHNIQPDVPLENVLALFEHARQYVPSYLR